VTSAGRDGETCDQGSGNTDAYQLNRTCLTDCDGYGSYCGDGKHDVEAGEACDDGNSELDGATVTNPDGNGCSATCSRLGSCGDGQAQYAFEDCDDGNTALEACSYGQDSCFVCDGSCAFAPGRTTYCGDGITQSEYEHCDGDTKPCTELS
jgi:cysteine-rich repeat protein